MPSEVVALAGWVAALIIAVPYVRHAKHPSMKPLAAYLMFTMALSAAAIGLFVALSEWIVAVGVSDTLDAPFAAAFFLTAVFVPAFLLARWLIRRPPRRPPAID